MSDPDDVDDLHVIHVRLAVRCSDHDAEQLEALVDERVRALAKEIEDRFGPKE